jgi:Restriction endonuclease
MAQEPLLPLNRLDPMVFEKVVAEYVWRLPGTRRVRLYGRSGQADYGLDAVAVTDSGEVTVYQAKRYQQLTPAKIREAVREYAGIRVPPGCGVPPRRFGASRFVLVTSAMAEDDTANVDEAERLIKEYEGDIGIDVVGAEQVSRVLHDSVSVVGSVFGADWARVFCGVEPPPAPAQDPEAYGLLEDPLSLLGLEAADQASREAAAAEPTRSAAIDEEITSELDAAGFPGHAQVIRRRAAATLLAAGQAADGFQVLYGLARSRLLSGAPLDPGLQFQMLTLASQNVLRQLDRARLTLLLAIHNWPSTGSGLAEAAPALAEVRAADDPDTGILACTILEHALVDGIFEHQPPRSLVGECPPETADLAQQVLALAGQVNVSDRLWRARIRCAVADAGLDLARAAGQVPSPSSAYAQLVNDASAERYPPGPASLVLSRAARAHAVSGEGAQAIDRWRASVTQACRARLYGDVRDLFRALRYVAIETDLSQVPNVSVVAEGLPNRERLLAGSGEPALAAFEASHNGDVRDAFEDSRRCLREARLAGHLGEEMIYLRLFGEVLGNADEPKEAVEVLAAAGAGTKAAELAARLGELADTGYLLSRPFGPPVAAAAQVADAQAQLVPDDQVIEIATALQGVAEKTWGPPGWGADPARRALEAISRLGVRIPASLADRLLAVITPALTAPSGHTGVAVSILVNLYLALPGRRAELAPRITALLSQPAAQPYIWGLLQNLREGRENLLPDLELRAAGEEQAIVLLAVWGTASPEVQLAARRAAARLLRWQTGIPREFLSSGMWDQVARLLVALLEAAGPLAAVAPADLRDSQDESGPGQPDEAAVLAAGDRAQLAATCADKLIAIASDSVDSIVSRHHAVAALRMLLPHLSVDLCARLAGDLARLHANPGLSEQDMWDLQSLRPLSSGHVDIGARTFSAAVLLAAAEACAQAGSRGMGDESLAAQIVDAAVNLVRSDDADVAEPGARALAVAAPFAGDTAVSPILLAAHPEERVRQQAVALWLAAGAPPGIIGRLARDQSPGVRAVVAHEAERAAAASPGEADAIRALADDPHYAVRHAYAHRRGQA